LADENSGIEGVETTQLQVNRHVQCTNTYITITFERRNKHKEEKEIVRISLSCFFFFSASHVRIRILISKVFFSVSTCLTQTKRTRIASG
jgi:hypothetical protein